MSEKIKLFLSLYMRRTDYFLINKRVKEVKYYCGRTCNCEYYKEIPDPKFTFSYKEKRDFHFIIKNSERFSLRANKRWYGYEITIGRNLND